MPCGSMRLSGNVLIARLRRAALVAGMIGCGSATVGDPQAPNAQLGTEVVASGLDTVWEVAWGPDGFIWFTERGGRISRLNPQTGAHALVGQVAVSESGEGGLMGLTFHPEFATEPWVYVAHTYSATGGTRNRIIRLRFNGTTLGSQEIVLADIPG